MYWLAALFLLLASIGAFCLVTSICFLIAMKRQGHSPVKLIRYNVEAIRFHVGNPPSGGTLPAYRGHTDPDKVLFVIPPQDWDR